MPEPFGAFAWICSHTPLPQCALFFRQLYRANPPSLTTLFPSTSEFYELYDVVPSSARGDPNVDAAVRHAGAGLGSGCAIARVGQRGSVGDVALIVLAGISALVAFGLTAHATRRRAAVGRSEIRMLLVAYGLHAALSCITMSSVLEQGSTPLVVLSAIHLAIYVTFFWILLANGIIATQVVEDGTPAALIPTSIIAVLFFGATLYISLDTGMAFTSAFTFSEGDVEDLKAITLFVLTLIWPAASAVGYLMLMVYITLAILREKKPALFYTLAFVLFAAAQVVFFLANQPLCEVSNGRVNSSFLATLLNTGALGVLYYAWISITEADWADDSYGAYGYGY